MVKKEKEPLDLRLSGSFPNLPPTKEERYALMIRSFGLLCKINLQHFSTVALFYQYMAMVGVPDSPCPRCGTLRPDWTKHAVYDRYLIGFEKNAVVCSTIEITRFMCSSCDSTHALLPEFIVPFKSHSLFFVLAVIKDLVTGLHTIDDLCAKYEISRSTLYTWKALFFEHKRIWLGILEDVLTSAERFLDYVRDKVLAGKLREFYRLANRSFLQRCGDPPRNGRFTPD